MQYTIEVHLGENGNQSVKKEEFDGDLAGAIMRLRSIEMETSERPTRGIVYNGPIEIQVFNYKK